MSGHEFVHVPYPSINRGNPVVGSHEVQFVAIP